MRKVAINGFGRIGRLVFKILNTIEDIEVVAINDLSDTESLAHLLKYDTCHGGYNENIDFNDNSLIVNGKKIKVFAEKDAHSLPWKSLKIDLVFECTGFYTKVEDAEAHINAGAKHLVISAPAKGDCKTIVYNVNHKDLTGEERIVSAASCTTNCLAPVVKILDDNFGIQQGYMTTIHAYTNDQTILDSSHKKGIKERRGRAAAVNIIPTSTGAAKAIGKVLPNLEGKLHGGAMRVPVMTGSLIDLSLNLNQSVSVKEINETFEKNQNLSVKVTNDPIVSSDIIGSKLASLIDLSLTDVVKTDDGEIVKIVSWYDNEMGYAYQLVRTARYLIKNSKYIK